MPTLVTNDRLRDHAERLATGSVARADLALGFEESVAASAEVLVEGRGFYPPMLADIAAATSSVHINQFGFRPGTIGEPFAEALLAKAGEGCRSGWSSTGRARRRGGLAGALRASRRRRDRGLRRSRTKPRAAVGPLGGGGGCAGTSPPSGTSTIASSWSSTAASAGSGGGDRGPLRRRPLPRPLPAGHRARSSRSCSSSSSRASAGSGGEVPADELDGLFPVARAGRGDPVPRPCCTTRPAATGRSPTRSRRRSTARARPSTSSTRTSPTAG